MKTIKDITEYSRQIVEHNIDALSFDFGQVRKEAGDFIAYKQAEHDLSDNRDYHLLLGE